MAKNWYPFYVGDYQRKTAHLSMLEHGAYRLLLDHYYATGAPLPNDMEKLCRICRARSPSERKAVAAVASEFFTQTGTLLHNYKCDDEIEKSSKFSATQSAKAKLRHSHGNANASALPQPQPQKINPKPLSVDKSEKGGFENFKNWEGFDILHHLDDDGLAKAKAAADGWDIYMLAKKYNEGVKDRGIPTHPAMAFAAWCGKYTKGITY